MYERRHHPVIPREEFRRRMLRHACLAVAVLLVALGIGVVGYHVTAGLSWIDSLLNAAMILSGMGPVDVLRDPGAKLFASFYALMSGVVFLGMASIVFAPMIHRLLHRFHIDDSDR